jgi:transposase
MKGFLSKEQKRELLDELRLEKSRRYADRIRVILLLDQGKTYKSISEHLFLDEGSIANYRKRYKEGGLEGLIIDNYKAKEFLLNEDQLLQLSIDLESKVFLSTKDIIAHIKKEFNVKYTVSGATKLLHRMGFSYKKPKAVPGKADREKQQEFIEAYKALKGKGKIYFSDSTHPQYNPVISYGWFKKGVEFDVFTNSGRFRLNINGAVCLDDMDIVARTCNRVNADSLCVLLKAIKEKNQSQEKLFLVMDNASFNRSKMVKEMAKTLGIELVYLPPYSPNLNPIERLWKFFKKKTLYNKYYESFDDFNKACVNFFRYARKYRPELETFLTDNFRVMGT